MREPDRYLTAPLRSSSFIASRRHKLHCRQLPQEICDLIIDVLGYASINTPLTWDPERLALQRCALVCRAWRARTQFWLFRTLELYDVPSLRSLSLLLDTRHVRGEILSSHVREVHLYCGGCQGYEPSNVATEFPVLASRSTATGGLALPGLRYIRVDGSTVRGPRYAKMLPPHLALHPRVSTLVARASCCRTVVVLELYYVRFASFSDFARLLGSFAGLEELKCNYIRWSVLGHSPGLMMQQKPRSKSQFLQRLRTFEVIHSCDFT